MRSLILCDSPRIAHFFAHLSLMALFASGGKSTVISAKGALVPASNPMASFNFTLPFIKKLGFGIGEHYCTRDPA